MAHVTRHNNRGPPCLTVLNIRKGIYEEVGNVIILGHDGCLRGFVDWFALGMEFVRMGLVLRPLFFALGAMCGNIRTRLCVYCGGSYSQRLQEEIWGTVMGERSGLNNLVCGFILVDLSLYREELKFCTVQFILHVKHLAHSYYNNMSVSLAPPKSTDEL